jgi:exosortase E/protease (VPEID-CTERM system)
MRGALRDLSAPLPAWRPLPLLAVQIGAFVATASIAHRVLGPAAPPASITGLLVVAGCCAMCAVIALATAAPLAWTARLVRVHLGAPIAALAVGLLAWRAAVLAEGLWGVLGGTTLRGVGALLRLQHPDVVLLPDERIVGLPGFKVIVAPICSGVDGLGLVLVIQVLWLSLARERLRFGRSLLLLPLGAAAALVANVVRIATLLAVGASGHEDLAMGAFHSKLGWLLFLGIALATVVVAEHVPWFRGSEVVTRDDEGVPRRAGAYAGPLVAAIATALFTSLWAEQGFDAWYGARVAVAALALLAVRGELPRPAVSVSWVSVLVGSAVCIAWIAWPRGEASPLAGLEQLAPAARMASIAVRVIGSCLVIPVIEELAFRGFLLPWLVAPDFEAAPPRAWTWPAVILSSLAFGAVHEHLLLGTAAGAAFAFARLWRDRLSDAVLAHALANAGVAVAVLGFGRWDLWN